MCMYQFCLARGVSRRDFGDLIASSSDLPTVPPEAGQTRLILVQNRKTRVTCLPIDLEPAWQPILHFLFGEAFSSGQKSEK